MIIDISQEILSCKVYPGDPVPKREVLCNMEKGDAYNLSAFSMCSHNGTHVDAPAHFFQKGNTIDKITLDHFVGDCYVARASGFLNVGDVIRIMESARKTGAKDRILLAGDVVVTSDAARTFAEAGIKLLGNESQSVGPEDAPMEVHKILLGADVVLLEGIVLTGVEEGKYFLSAAPLNIEGCEGAPCRAYLVKR